jgi:hypothetical protein
VQLLVAELRSTTDAAARQRLNTCSQNLLASHARLCYYRLLRMPSLVIRWRSETMEPREHADLGAAATIIQTALDQTVFNCCLARTHG